MFTEMEDNIITAKSSPEEVRDFISYYFEKHETPFFLYTNEDGVENYSQLSAGALEKTEIKNDKIPRFVRFVHESNPGKPEKDKKSKKTLREE